MNSDETRIKFDVDTWKIKTRERRNNRMRLQINLSKDEALAFKNFASICKPEEVSDEDFMKTVFLTGIESLNKQLADLVQKYAKENKEELAASGITVLEADDGQIKLAETSQLEKDVSGAIPATTPENFLDKAQTADKLNDDIKKYNK